MITRFLSKEFLSWIVLLVSILLLSVSMTFAQGASSNNGKVTVKIVKEIDGKTERLDTTFDFIDEASIREILKKIDPESEVNVNLDMKNGKSGRIIIRSESKQEDEDIREELEKDIDRSFDEGNMNIEEAIAKIKDINIKFSDEDGESFSFEFEMPSSDEHGMKIFKDCKKDLKITCDSISKAENLEKRIEKHIILNDGSGDEEHIMLHGDKNESAPVFEKEIVNSDGSKTFVYKRQQAENDEAEVKSEQSGGDTEKEILPGVEEFSLYPNPGPGILNVSFVSSSKADTEIRIMDSNGKVVIEEIEKNQIGSFQRKFNLNKAGKGTYYLQFSHNGRIISRKIIIK